MARGFGARESGFGPSKREREEAADAKYNIMDDPELYPPGGSDEPDYPDEESSSRDDNRVPGGPEDQEDEARQMGYLDYEMDEEGYPRPRDPRSPEERARAAKLDGEILEQDRARVREKMKEIESKFDIKRTPKVADEDEEPVHRGYQDDEDEVGVTVKSVPNDEDAVKELNAFLKENKESLINELKTEIERAALSRFESQLQEDGSYRATFEDNSDAETIFDIGERRYVLDGTGYVTADAVEGTDHNYEPYPTAPSNADSVDFNYDKDDTQLRYLGPKFYLSAKAGEDGLGEMLKNVSKAAGDVRRAIIRDSGVSHWSMKQYTDKFTTKTEDAISNYNNARQAVIDKFEQASKGQPEKLVNEARVILMEELRNKEYSGRVP